MLGNQYVARQGKRCANCVGKVWLTTELSIRGAAPHTPLPRNRRIGCFCVAFCSGDSLNRIRNHRLDTFDARALHFGQAPALLTHEQKKVLITNY